MITGRAVSALLLQHHRRVVIRRAVNYDFAGALKPVPLVAGSGPNGIFEIRGYTEKRNS